MLELTLTDLFCGAGGSSFGALAVPGIIVRMAVNHWRLAVNTHNLNHPGADHDCADLSQVNPRKYPRTNLAWMSPECTNHSGAKGKKRDTDSQPGLFDEKPLDEEAAQRSRATMWDVLRFTEHHEYDAVIVENVVEASKWSLYPAWRHGFDALEYCVHVIYMNSMHFQAFGRPAPQSRDRSYHAAHKKGTPCPDFNKWTRPKAYCPNCDEVVNAMQAWKKPNAAWGRYRAQYVWRCPSVKCRNSVVEPGFLPAGTAIDWSLPGQRIGDRKKPLAAKTMHRIEAFFERHPDAWFARPEIPANTYGSAALVPCEGREGKTAQSAAEALRTQTSRNETGLAFPPFMVEMRGGGSMYRSLEEPMATVTAGGNHHGLVVPAGGTWNEDARSTSEPFRTLTTRDSYGLVVPYNRTGVTRSTDEPFGTFTTRDRYAMVMRNNTGGAEMITPVSQELRTLTTAGHQSLLHGTVPNIDDCHFRMLEPHEIQAGMAFAADYTILGNKREKVRQLGNAVTPPAARDLIAAVAESLGSDLELAA
ncbi:MAG TPA: DNA cytosine methyltransferase [Kribbella sp.]